MRVSSRQSLPLFTRPLSRTTPIKSFPDNSPFFDALSRSKAAAPASRQETATPAPVRQSTATPAQAASTQPLVADAAPAENPGLTALKVLMRAAGINPDSVSMGYSEDVVGFPGGSYMNKSITVTNASGQTERFDANLTLKNPSVTLFEMSKYLGINA